MKKTIILTAALGLLAACDMSPLLTGMQDTVDMNAREAAKAVVIPIVLQTEIAPGVPWCFATSAGASVAITLKSGNFGAPGFFAEALAALAPA